jgi:hypothetical protein
MFSWAISGLANLVAYSAHSEETPLVKLSEVHLHELSAQQKVVRGWLSQGKSIDDFVGEENGVQIGFIDWAVRHNDCDFARFLKENGARVRPREEWGQFLTDEMMDILGLVRTISVAVNVANNAAAITRIEALSLGTEITDENDVEGCRNGIHRLALHLMSREEGRRECFREIYERSTIPLELWYKGIKAALRKNLGPVLQKIYNVDLLEAKNLGLSYFTIVDIAHEKFSNEQCYWVKEEINKFTRNHLPGIFYNDTYRNLCQVYPGEFYEPIRQLKSSLDKDWKPPSPEIRPPIEEHTPY